MFIFAARLKKKWELSSAGSEHLPYKQRVTGSNPVAPTKPRRYAGLFFFFNYDILLKPFSYLQVNTVKSIGLFKKCFSTQSKRDFFNQFGRKSKFCNMLL